MSTQKKVSDAFNTKSTKRQQIEKLLIDKFRTKYQIKLATEQELDIKLIAEIHQGIGHGDVFNEKHLVELQKKVHTLVQVYRA